MKWFRPGDAALWGLEPCQILRVVDMGQHERYARVLVHSRSLPYWVNWRYLEISGDIWR